MPVPAILAALALGGANIAHDRSQTRADLERRTGVADSTFKALGLDIPGQPRIDGADLDPVRQRRLTGIHELLTAEDANLQQRGFSIAASVTESGMNMAQLAAEQEAVALETAEVGLASSRFELSTAYADAGINRDLLHQKYQAGAANMVAAAAGTPLDLTKPVPIRQNPWTQSATVAYLPGTKEFNIMQSAVDATDSIARDVNRLAELTNMFGSEIWNDEAVGEMRALHTSLPARLSQFFGSGTPQAAELEIYNSMLPNPNDWSTNVGTMIGHKDRYLAAFNGVSKMMSKKLKQQSAINPYLKVNFSTFHPAVLSPEMQEFIKANSPDPGVYINAQ